MASAIPDDSYRDPTPNETMQFDRNGNDVYGHANNGFNGQRAISDGYYRDIAPEAHISSTGPPISYRGVSADTDPGMHRSFSQRARGRPFAEEAFADEDDMADFNLETPTSRSRRTVPETQAPAPLPKQHIQTPRAGKTAAPRTVPLEPANQLPVSAATPRTPSSAPKALHSTRTRNANEAVKISPRENLRTPKQRSDESKPARKGWASDRSPLQKLEVKLTDISKEEKRARVQEAEMKLMREKGLYPAAAPQSRPGRSVSGGNRSVQQQPHLRSITTTEKGSGPFSMVKDQASQTRTIGAPDASASTISKKSNHGFAGSLPTHVKKSQSTNAKVATKSRSKNASSGLRTSSGPLPRPRRNDEEQSISDWERNASHKAALELLTGQHQNRPTVESRGPTGNSVTPSRASPRRQSSPLAVDLTSMAGGDPRIDLPQQKHLSRQADRPAPFSAQSRDPPAIGLGLQQPKALRSVDSPPVSLTDASKQRHRKSSVSFKEPFDRRRPIDEWRQATTARLSLADFTHEQVAVTDSPVMNKTWWEQDRDRPRRRSHTRSSSGTVPPLSLPQRIDDRTAQFSPRLHVKCGPLLRYAGMKRIKTESQSQPQPQLQPQSQSPHGEQEIWKGSIMIVTQDSQCDYSSVPTLRLFSRPTRLLPPPPPQINGQLAPEYIDPIAGIRKLGRTGKALYVRPVDHLEEAKDLSCIEDDNGIYESSPSPMDIQGSAPTTMAVSNDRSVDVDGETLGRYKEIPGVRLYADPDRDVTFWRFSIEVELGPEQQHIAYRINKGAALGFWVPARGQTMNIMFHSCNGFSSSVDPNQFSGPDPLWRDVLNNHQTRPFHVMIGGGDQIYNDRVMVDTQWFGNWTKIKTPHLKYQAPFTHAMKEELESFYLERYCMWFSQGLFALANSSIPMINIWDDHDIIDGYGSYPNFFMRTPVMSGLGNVAFKYYMLFQHQAVDAMTEKDDPSWVLGRKPGPFIRHRSRSVYLELGQSVAFLGIDCRTERHRDKLHEDVGQGDGGQGDRRQIDRVLTNETLDDILERCRTDLIEGQTKHLIVLLGVPIAYPRLVWLENILTSPATKPIKALGRAGVITTKLLNKFDGGVEIADDLDDHWTSSHHKEFRNALIQDLQDLAMEKSVRVTILGGDVHLAAVGQFYSNPKLKIPKDRDHRYMPNVISSAIVNTPPGDMLADVLNKRDKVHHLDKYTDENMIPMFTHDVNDKPRNNTHLLPRRNWCSIREYQPGDTPPPSIPDDEHSMLDDDDDNDGQWSSLGPPKRKLSLRRQDFNPRNLMRRISSKGAAPPSAFPSVTQHPQNAHSRSTSLDAGLDRTHAALHNSSATGRANSADQVTDVPALRPTFHRRPTNLSERAARKGNVPFIDEAGHEHDLNGHIDLAGGLDVVINCEIDQKDPGGCTTPYRLLIPALLYDGSSDREKLEDAVLVGRRESVLKKLGLGSKKSHGSARNQGADDWDQTMSDSDSGLHSDAMVVERPRRAFSLFGSKKKKNPAIASNDQPPAIVHPHEYNGLQKPVLPQTDAGGLVSGQSIHSGNVAGPAMSQTTTTKPSAPSVQSRESQAVLPPQSAREASKNQQTSQDLPQRDFSFRRESRPTSYTISGSPQTYFDESPQIGSGPGQHNAPYDPDAAYVSAHTRAQAVPRPSGQDSFSQGPHLPQRAASQTRRDPSLSKQEQVLGIGSVADAYQSPRQTQLRGNGIIGKNYKPSSSATTQGEPHTPLQTAPSAFPYNNTTSGVGHEGGRPSDFHANPLASQPTKLQQGYSGVEAYQDPNKRRRWSLKIRDRARSIRDSLEGRRRAYTDDESDFDSGEDSVLDDEENGQWHNQRGQPSQHPQQTYHTSSAQPAKPVHIAQQMR